MKNTIVAALFSTALLTGVAHAGALSDPILEADVIEAATASDGGLLVPIIFLILALPAIAG